jgi:hypothetical protein
MGTKSRARARMDQGRLYARLVQPPTVIEKRQHHTDARDRRRWLLQSCRIQRWVPSRRACGATQLLSDSEALEARAEAEKLFREAEALLSIEMQRISAIKRASSLLR